MGLKNLLVPGVLVSTLLAVAACGDKEVCIPNGDGGATILNEETGARRPFTGRGQDIDYKSKVCAMKLSGNVIEIIPFQLNNHQ